MRFFDNNMRIKCSSSCNSFLETAPLKTPSFFKTVERKKLIEQVSHICLKKLDNYEKLDSLDLKNKINFCKKLLNKSKLNGVQVLSLSIGVFVLGVFKKDGKNIRALLESNAKVKKQLTSIKQIKVPKTLEIPIELKGKLSFFNDYFPNVVVVGNVNGKDGSETRRQLDAFGIKYETRGPFDGTTIPPQVWSMLSHEIDQDDGKVRIPLSEKVKLNQELNEEEKDLLKKIRGTAACFMLHRDVIMKTIHAYNQALAEMEILKSKPLNDGNEKAIEEVSCRIRKYSSLFVFEHNGRFGYVGRNNKVSLSTKLKDHLEKVLKQLPKDWEFFTLLNNDIKKERREFPKDLTNNKSNELIYPGIGMMSKGFAISSRFYPDLKACFEKITPESADEIFYPLDAQIVRLSREAKKMGRRFQLAPARTMMYRAAGESFHANHKDPKSYANRNLAGTTYRKNIFNF